MAPKVSTKFSNKKENNNTNEKEQNFVKMKKDIQKTEQLEKYFNANIQKSPLLILLITAAGQLITS
ncbi:hypothetical protein T4C_11591 [Trichinella pseudospiralis]|uniref:Uncharacterized protein n=1 Tax=Trichinella pseudospiralis TaxID=6337 RepID=A0A0V1KDC5_TRIPS|nr:hypothetical protein T4C_11591 [Trichinella pseudospiralis]